MKRIGILLSTAAATIAGLMSFPGSASASASTVCVGVAPGCYHSVQVAVDAAPAGSVVRVGAGTFHGGHGSVLTIGAFGASTEPSVSIEGLTITGGVVRLSPESTPFAGEEGVYALGGGVEIPPNADFSGGATVRITDSVITGNRVAPSRTVDSGLPCPNGSCPFAEGAGGGRARSHTGGVPGGHYGVGHG